MHRLVILEVVQTRGRKPAASNPRHGTQDTDPDDVLLLMLYGEKKMVIAGKEIDMKTGDEIFIPANTKHRAIYTGDSLMLSFGLEKFLVNKL